MSVAERRTPIRTKIHIATPSPFGHGTDFTDSRARENPMTKTFQPLGRGHPRPGPQLFISEIAPGVEMANARPPEATRCDLHVRS